MYGTTLLDEVSTPSDNSDLLELLQDQLRDLLLIHLQQSQLATTQGPTQEWPSMYLKESRYVSGGRSAAKSSMRFALRIGPEKEAGNADVTLILTLNVEVSKC